MSASAERARPDTIAEDRWSRTVLGSAVFGELVRDHRRRLGLTQEDLAERAGVSVRSVGKWESGTVAAPRLWTVRMLADAFGLEGADREVFCRSGTDAPTDSPVRTDQIR
jgi:transcriptional regulator with XRE-family HTH domain